VLYTSFYNESNQVESFQILQVFKVPESTIGSNYILTHVHVLQVDEMYRIIALNCVGQMMCWNYCFESYKSGVKENGEKAIELKWCGQIH
jgi:hypothetical protein